MEILSSIEQESASLALEKWTKRPRIALNSYQDELVEERGSLIQFTTSCTVTKAAFYNFVISSALDDGGDVLILDFDSSVKISTHLLELFSDKKLKDHVHIYKAYNW